MQDLRIHRLIPLATGALLGVSCGGKALDDPNYESPSGGGVSDPENVDVSNDAQFEQALDTEIDDWCEHQVDCEYYSSVSECRSDMGDLNEYFDLDSDECREALLRMVDCLNENFSCSGDAAYEQCDALARRQIEACFDFDYSDYDYEYGDSGYDYDEY